MLDIKQRLKQLRKDNGLTMAEFAQRIAVSPGNVGDWESESRSSIPGAKALISIAETFQVSVDWILLGLPTAPADPSTTADGRQSGAHDAITLLALIEELPPQERRILGEIARRLHELTRR